LPAASSFAGENVTQGLSTLPISGIVGIMAANARAFLPILFFLAAWAGLPGRVLVLTGASAGAPYYHFSTDDALSGVGALSYALPGEESAGRSFVCLRGRPGTEAPSRPDIAG